MCYCRSARRGYGMPTEDMLTINVGSFVHSMEFCNITSPIVKQQPSMSLRYHRILMHDIVIMTGHSNGRIRAWDVKTGEFRHFVVLPLYNNLLLNKLCVIIWHHFKLVCWSTYEYIIRKQCSNAKNTEKPYNTKFTHRIFNRSIQKEIHIIVELYKSTTKYRKLDTEWHMT